MIEFKVEPDDGDAFKVTATSRDLFVWEKAGRGRSFSSLMQDMHMVDMYWIAHHVSRRLGLTDLDLAEFEKSVDLVLEGDDEPDPTQPAASPEP